MTDLIRRMDAVQACQVGPSDEWSSDTKSGYNQAATDCAMNMLRIPAVHPNDRIEALTADNARLRGACEGAVNWLDALAEQINATSCDPDDPEAFDEVLMGAGMFLANARAALNAGKEVMPPVPVNDATNASDIGPGDQAVAGAAGHRSDCAIHNAPAYPAGPCDCGFSAGAAEDFATEIIDSWIARNEPAVPLVSADAILHGLGLMLDGQHVPVREFYAFPQGLFRLKGDTLGLRCATDGCGQHVSVRLERDGVSTDYCEPCGLRAARK